ncbi:crotonase/enoyl-CoA hydratase family protein [Permianibacter sp. IMCC34836]|uniref:crotonase/enoyl-CoA hydratase family protein n=1 Tax=Permianibacter fluminis TaxID=2738515 RepID=UPI00155419E7|nr:crotonase/enoyl-CoA hydratase family protein [Permianibacter fluminis]NQD35966.1 crotonase/enoyl-CoA hydratase family protein [Permianibacter fluminis]
MTSPRLLVQIQQGIAHVTLNRPDKRNALDLAMFQAIDRVIGQLKRDRSVRAIILAGAGEDFCSGLDIKSVFGNPLTGLQLLWKWLPGNANLAQRVSVGWRRLPVPVIAAIHGRCWGGGLQIALGADYRIATPEASLSIMEAKWGIIPDMGGTLALRELLPVDVAMRLASTAELLSGNEAQALGLLTAVVNDPYAAAQALAQTFVARSPDSVAAAKRLYHYAWSANARAVLARETALQWRLLLGANQKIAVQRAKAQADNQPEKPYRPRGRW